VPLPVEVDPGDQDRDRGDASGTGYWSPSEERWRPDVLERAVGQQGGGWAERLPTVLGPGDPSDWVSASVHEQLGLRGRPLCGPGTGDNMAAALGIGLQPGDVAISLGTSGTVYAVADRPTADATGAVAGFADASGRFLPLVCTLNATEVTDAIARLLGVDRHALAALALTAPAGAGGAVLVPYFNGERTPNRPDATGTLAGLRTDFERADIARATKSVPTWLAAPGRFSTTTGSPASSDAGTTHGSVVQALSGRLSKRYRNGPVLASTDGSGGTPSPWAYEVIVIKGAAKGASLSV